MLAKLPLKTKIALWYCRFGYLTAYRVHPVLSAVLLHRHSGDRPRVGGDLLYWWANSLGMPSTIPYLDLSLTAP